MQKKLLFSAMLTACIAFTASAQYVRRVLVEEFTNASCPPCASQNPGFNAVLASSADIITPIKYQTVWPGFDPMNQQNPSEVAARVTYYGVNGVPNAFVGGVGVVNDCNAYDNAPACLTNAELVAAAAVTSPVEIVLSHSISAGYDSILISVSVTSDIALTGALRLHVGVIENEIIFDAPPGSTNEEEFFQVMRKMLPNANGTTTGDFAAGETKTYNFAWPIGYAYDLNELAAVAWLQDNGNKAVFNSARTQPIGGIQPAGVTLFNTMNPLNCVSGTSPTFTLTNSGDAALTNANLRYKVGAGAWVNFAWTGNLAAGESEVVTLTDVTLDAPGTVDVLVKLVSSNNGAQTDLVEVTTIKITSALAASAPLPMTNTFQSATFPPTDWTVVNIGTNGWKLATNAGAGSTRSAKNNFYDYASGSTIMMAPKMDLTGASGSTSLVFDHAYAYYSAALYDSLRIEASTDCGVTWTTIFHDGFQGLATAPVATAAFTPTAAQWRNNSIDMSAFNGEGDVFVRFIAESGYGNNLYIDNVNVSSSTGVKHLELSSFTLSPNPSSAVSDVRFELATAQNMQLMVYNALGSLVQTRDLGMLTSGKHSVSLDAARLNSGSYRVVLQGKEGIAQTQWIVLK